MDNLFMWRCVLWGAPMIGGIIALIANIKVDRILEKQNVDAKKEVIAGPTYNITSKNQSGGFTGVINNDIDDLDEKRALRLLNEVHNSPSKFAAIYDQLMTLSISPKHFSEFKKLVDLANKLWEEKEKEKKDPMDENPFQRLKNRTMPFLLSVFPKETYSDISLDKEFDLCSMFQDNSNYERERFIKVLNEVLDESSIKSHKYAIKSMLIDLCAYSPELLPVFEKTFGKKKTEEIKKLWDKKEWSLVDNGYQSLISKLNK